MEPSADSKPLEYAQRPPAMRRWRWRIVFAALAVVLAALAITRGPAVWDRAMLLYWQRQCMNYRAPADQVVYDTSSADPHAHVPEAARELFARAEVRGLYQMEGVLFMHRLTSPGGVRRLVIVTFWEPGAPSAPNAVSVYVIDPFGWRRPGTVEMPEVNGLPRLGKSLKIYAGQIDPDDLSHFTIRFKRQHEGVIEGRLADDGQVHLQFRGSKEDGFDLPLETP
jgi:hypothetical protein